MRQGHLHTSHDSLHLMTLICAQAVGLPKGALQSFVLGNDPIPRTILSVDWPWLRRWWSGTAHEPETVPVPGSSIVQRSRLDNGGDMFLIRWHLDSKPQVCTYAMHAGHAVSCLLILLNAVALFRPVCSKFQSYGHAGLSFAPRCFIL